MEIENETNHVNNFGAKFLELVFYPPDLCRVAPLLVLDLRQLSSDLGELGVDVLTGRPCHWFLGETVVKETGMYDMLLFQLHTKVHVCKHTASTYLHFSSPQVKDSE